MGRPRVAAWSIFPFALVTRSGSVWVCEAGQNYTAMKYKTGQQSTPLAACHGACPVFLVFRLALERKGQRKKKWFIIMGTANDIDLAIVCCDTSPSNGDWWIWWRAQRMADRQVVINLWTRGCGLLLLVMDDWLWDIVTLWPSKRYWDSALFFYFE